MEADLIDPLILPFVFITFAVFLAFLNGIVAEAQPENTPASNTFQNAKIQRLFDEKHIVTTSFLFLEIILYLLSAINLSVYAFFLSLFQGATSYLLLVFIILATFFIRTTMYSIGIRFSDKLFGSFAKIIYFFYVILQFLGKFYLLLFRKISSRSEEASLEDIQEVVETAHEEGTLQTGEYKIFSNVIKFNQVPVSDVMTPRTVIFACPADFTIEEALKLPEIKTFSRFPIYDGNSIDDKIVGYVVTKDIFQEAINNHLDKKLRELAREIHFIPENVTLDDALNQFLSKRQHIFLVVDEFGGIEGLVTMEDLIETILGEEIIDEADKYIDLREVAKRKRENRLRYKSDEDVSQ
jgi:CBS domain containing-hemolysin-like protein